MFNYVGGSLRNNVDYDIGSIRTIIYYVIGPIGCNVPLCYMFDKNQSFTFVLEVQMKIVLHLFDHHASYMDQNRYCLARMCSTIVAHMYS